MKPLYCTYIERNKVRYKICVEVEDGEYYVKTYNRFDNLVDSRLCLNLPQATTEYHKQIHEV